MGHDISQDILRSKAYWERQCYGVCSFLVNSFPAMNLFGTFVILLWLAKNTVTLRIVLDILDNICKG